MTDPKNRILIALVFSSVLLLFNIIAVSTGTAEKLYIQLENSISS